MTETLRCFYYYTDMVMPETPQGGVSIFTAVYFLLFFFRYIRGAIEPYSYCFRLLVAAFYARYARLPLLMICFEFFLMLDVVCAKMPFMLLICLISI